MVELLNIKTIKLNSWCDTFRERVRSARNIELKSQLVKNFVYGFTFLLMFLLQPMLIIAVFSALMLHGLPMTLS